MALFAIVIALLLEQVRPLAAGNLATVGLRHWVRAVGQNVDAGGVSHGWLAWTLAVVAPALAAAAVGRLLDWLVGWPLALAWTVWMLYLTLGFRQFSHHFTGIRDALEAGDDARARQLLARWQQVDVSALPRSDVARRVIEHSVLAAHSHVFGVLLWFCLSAMLGLGPAGAVLFRNAEFARRYWPHKARTGQQPVSPALVSAAQQAWQAVNWLPARATALGMAMVGSFEEAIEVWRNHAHRFADGNDGVVLAATAGALGVRLGDNALKAPSAVEGDGPLGTTLAAAAQPLPGDAPSPAHFSQVIGLLWRMVALWLLLLVLLTLARVVG
ncbi:CobD/CbiB family protein [Ottowia sp.]|uniref:CobD/CbiB family protein n=1 Tax=Ottowia sp. TaxID=1898956 RepID=UPI003A85099A